MQMHEYATFKREKENTNRMFKIFKRLSNTSQRMDV